MTKPHALQRLAKLIDYILARRPDEFGLVPDPDGFIKIKELLKAINEEDGFKYVRRSHLTEILLSQTQPAFEIAENCIRAKTRQRLPQPVAAPDPPRLLFTCVRKKAYPFVLNRGLGSGGQPSIILSAERALAKRIGQRRDREAVLLTIHVRQAIANGTGFQRVGESLYLADFIAADCLSGPRLPKEKPPAPKPELPPAPRPPKTPGSFLIDAAQKLGTATAPSAAKRVLKKRKRRRQPPPWRK